MAEAKFEDDNLFNNSGNSYRFKKMGVEKTLIAAGDGITFPKSGDKLKIHYTGTLASDNSTFDSSRRGEGFEFRIGVGEVIKGLDVGVIQMCLGEKASLRISPEFGYGERGIMDKIPANATLIFDVELLAIESAFYTAEPEPKNTNWLTIALAGTTIFSTIFALTLGINQYKNKT